MKWARDSPLPVWAPRMAQRKERRTGEVDTRVCRERAVAGADDVQGEGVHVGVGVDEWVTYEWDGWLARASDIRPFWESWLEVVGEECNGLTITSIVSHCISLYIPLLTINLPHHPRETLHRPLTRKDTPPILLMQTCAASAVS